MSSDSVLNQSAQTAQIAQTTQTAQPETTENSPKLENNEVLSYETFDDMNLPTNLLRGVYSYGFEHPSTIQKRAIVALTSGRDLIAQSQSGTGKTGAFTIGLLAKLKILDEQCPQGIIISPTHELAEQTYQVITALSQKMQTKIVLCIGGTSVQQDIRQLRQPTDVVIGTPGRIFDLINRRALNTTKVHLLILDEADEMLSQGFKRQIYDIFVQLPQSVQVGLFSATLPVEVRELTSKFMRDPLKILVKNDELTLEGIRQFHIKLDREEWKLDTIIDLWNTLSLTQTIVYVNTRRKCQWLTQRLSEQGYAVAEIHSSLSPKERKSIMQGFKSGGTRILITTDLLSRGIDVQQVALVVNYDLPQNVETYLHRIGRSGRFGRKGLAINFIGRQEDQRLQDICRFYSTEIPEMPSDIGRFL